MKCYIFLLWWHYRMSTRYHHFACKQSYGSLVDNSYFFCTLGRQSSWKILNYLVLQPRYIIRIEEMECCLNTIYGSWESPECLCCASFRYIRIGDKECEFNKNFRLILHTKLANPHYKPELQAQTTLLNFTVTEDGLEAQLLAEVVSIERPDLEKLKVKIMKSAINPYSVSALPKLECLDPGV